MLASWEQGPEPSDADWRWLAVESAAVALEDKGPDDTLSSVWESMPGADLDARLAAVRATGHPDAGELACAVAEFAASGAPRSIDQVAELKVCLVSVHPPIWRRVRLPATASLGDLHCVILRLFGWDGDHLHVFRAGKKGYGDPFVGLEGTQDEDAVRIKDAMAQGAGALEYTYDLGACWEHEITLERTLARDSGQDYPVCVAYKGDSPVEYWSEDEPLSASRSTGMRSTASWPRSAGRRTEVAVQAVEHDDKELSLGSLVTRSVELKRALVDLAVSPR